MSAIQRRIIRKPNFLMKGCWVYRVENDKGQGPFKPSAASFNKDKDWFCSKRNRELLWRKPYEEFDVNQLIVFGFFSNKHLRFGCKTVKQLFTWFNNDELKKLAEKGYKVRRIWAERGLNGEDQCLFYSRRYAKESETIGSG